MGSILAVIQWVQFGQKVFQAGKPALDAVLAAAANHGIEQDTTDLNALVIELAQLKAEADAEAKATS